MWRAIIAAALLATAAQAQEVVSPKADAVIVTLYHDDSLSTAELLNKSAWSEIQLEGLAFITETRTVDLPAGPAIIRFKGVTSTMVPQTADIQGLPAGVLERNFNYDLLSPGSLLAKSIGQTVHLVRSDPKTGKASEQTAIVRSGPEGAVLEIDGKFEALRCSGLPEKLVFDKMPDGLSDTPTLSVRTLSPKAGRYTVKLSYIATGLNWSADYVAHVRAGGAALDLTGWITLANFSATSFPKTPIAVVAGRVNQTGGDMPVQPTPVVFADNCWPTNIDWATHRALPVGQERFDEMPPPPPPPPMAANAVSASPITVVVTAERTIDPRALGDYKLYPLPEPTTLAAQQTKQVQFLDRPDVKFQKIYRADAFPPSDNGPAEPPEIVFRLDNTTETGLGKPLPAGTVSVMERAPRGGLVFAGQHAIGDTAVGSPIEIATGHAMDVQADFQFTSRDGFGDLPHRHFRDTIEFTIHNGKSVAAPFELQGELPQGATILAETHPHIVKWGKAVWAWTLAPGERVTFTYTVEYSA